MNKSVIDDVVKQAKQGDALQETGDGVFLCVVWAPPRRELWVTAGFPPSLQPCQPSIILGQPFVERTITEGT